MSKIIIKSKREPFRRAGLAHTKAPVEHDTKDLTAGQMKQLLGEPMLTVTDADGKRLSTSGTESQSAGPISNANGPGKDENVLSGKTVAELEKMAEHAGIPDFKKMKKDALVAGIEAVQQLKVEAKELGVEGCESMLAPDLEVAVENAREAAESSANDEGKTEGNQDA